MERASELRSRARDVLLTQAIVQEEKIDEAEPAEPESVQQKRAQYNKDISDYKARVQQAQLARARADQLDSRLSKATTTLLVDDLLTRMPLPYMPGTIESAIEDYWRLATELVNAPTTWWRMNLRMRTPRAKAVTARIRPWVRANPVRPRRTAGPWDLAGTKPTTLRATRERSTCFERSCVTLAPAA